MIVVEGPDGAGKTTLILRIQQLTKLPISPRVVSQEAKAMLDLKEWTEENVTLGFQPKIFDRHRMISELIYGPILRGAPEPPFHDWEWLSIMTKRFYDTDPVLIYCLPPLETVIRNVENDPHNTVVKNNIEPIYSLYTSRFALDAALRPDRVILWNYESPQEEMKIDFLVTFIEAAVDQKVYRR